MNFPFSKSPIKGNKVGKPHPPQSHPILEFISKPTESTKDRISTKNVHQQSSHRFNSGPKVSKMLPDAFNLPQSPKQRKFFHFQNFTSNKNENVPEHLASVDDVRVRKLTIDSEDSKKQETAEYMLFDGKVKRKRPLFSSKIEKDESPVKMKSQRLLSGEPSEKRNLVFLIKNGKVERKKDKFRKAFSPDLERNLNPIAPVREFLKWQKSSENLKSDIYESNVSKPKFNISDMITIESRQMQSGKGLIKKILHAPTFKVLISKEISLSSSKISTSLKQWERKWQKNFECSNRLIKFLEIFWNSPEGFATVVFEYVPFGSLEDILESYITLPEPAIKDLCNEMIKASLEFSRCHDIILDQIFIPKRILVTSLGTLRYVIPLPNSSAFNAVNTNTNKEIIRRSYKDITIFEIIYILIISLFGNEMEKLEINDDLSKICCIFHYILKLNSLSSNFSTLLLEIFSAQISKCSSTFKNFVCVSPNEENILEHPFVTAHNNFDSFELRNFSRKNLRWQDIESGESILSRISQRLRILNPKLVSLKQKQMREISLLSEELGISEEFVREKVLQHNFPN